MSLTQSNWSISIGGRSLTGSVPRDDEAVELQEIEVPAGIAGTLTTRTDDNTGILTVPNAHGITDSDTVTVSWLGGIQRTVDVTATTATTISIDLGVGTNLPVVTTATIVSKEIISVLVVPANAMKVLAIQNRRRTSIVVLNGATPLLTLDIATSEGYLWNIDNGFAIPISSNPISSVIITNCSAIPDTIYIGVLKNTV